MRRRGFGGFSGGFTRRYDFRVESYTQPARGHRPAEGGWVFIYLLILKCLSRVPQQHRWGKNSCNKIRSLKKMIDKAGKQNMLNLWEKKKLQKWLRLVETVPSSQSLGFTLMGWEAAVDSWLQAVCVFVCVWVSVSFPTAKSMHTRMLVSFARRLPPHIGTHTHTNLSFFSLKQLEQLEA